MSKNLKIVGFVSAVMAIPIAISALLFNVIPDFSHLVLLFLIPLAIIHPLLGFNILESIGFVEPKAVVIEKKEESTVMTFTKPDLYIDQLPELTKRMLELTDLEEMKASENDETPFKILITQQKEDYKCQVHKLKSKDFFFRIVVDFEATPEEAFDFLSEITKRPQWDEICQDAGIIEQISHKTSIQYMKTKGIWPTAPRDALVLSFITKLDDGRYMNVTKSIDEHKDYQPSKGDVRMIAHIAGLIIGKHPTNPKYCRCIQIVDGDLGGWLPASVVSMVTTQAFPISMRRANSKLKKIQNHKTVSMLIEASEGRGSGQVKAEKKQVQKPNALGVMLKYLHKSQPFMILLILITILRRR